MKFFLKPIIPLIILTLIINSCKNYNDMDFNTQSNENIIYTIFERSSEPLIPLNNGIFHDIDKIELIGMNTELSKKLVNEINKIQEYDLDFSKIKRITFSSANYFTYTIPFNHNNSELIIVTSSNSLSIVISKQITLANGIKRFIIFNHKNKPLLKLDQNIKGMIGNRVFFQNDLDSFLTSSSFPIINNNNINSNTVNSDCAGSGSFSDCMQCMWDECSSSWVCGAILALQPGPTIAFSVALCGLDTIAHL